jgi:hypothetical protein
METNSQEEPLVEVPGLVCEDCGWRAATHHRRGKWICGKAACAEMTQKRQAPSKNS